MPRRVDFARALAAAGLLLAAAGCSARGDKPAPAATANAADQTRLIFERNCVICHGPSGEGKQVGTMVIPSLRQGAALTDPDERLFQQISDGGKGMPPFKHNFDDRQIRDLVRFVREQIQKR
jgi:mono/diheme cytochrome c family protein